MPEANPQSTGDQTTIGRDQYTLSGRFEGASVHITQHNYAPIASPATETDRKDRRVMRERQRAIWIDGYLKQSLWNDALIDLGLAERPDAVPNPAQPYRLARRTPGAADRMLASGQRITTVYDEQQGAILILGAPGSGKTIQLLELMRDLLDRAAADETHPIPVKFDLSAWGKDQPPLDAWMATQLHTQFGMSRNAATQWVQAGIILPLLDGLDEVAEVRRNVCAAAINTYRAERGLQPLVVCCREREYATLADLLRLHAAVVVQPLSEEQVFAYLDAGGERLAGVRKLIADDPELIAEDVERNRLLATPLMLSIVTTAYADVPIVHLRGTTPAQRRTEVFDRFISKALTRTDKPVDVRFPGETTQRWLQWLAWQLRRTSRSTYQMEEMQPGWLMSAQDERFYRWSCRLVGGLVVVLVGGLAGGLVSGLVLGLVFGLVVGLVVVLGGVLDGEVIEPVDTLSWSWQASWMHLRSNLGFVLGGGLAGGLVSGLVLGLSLGLVVVLVLGLVLGLTTTSITNRLQPNAGIRASLRNGLGGVLGGVLIGGLGGVLGGVVGGMLVLGLVLGLSVGLRYGLATFLNHHILRLILFWRRLFPWDIIAFCDYCAARALLRRVGGGWQFPHRLILEHLADQYEQQRAVTGGQQ